MRKPDLNEIVNLMKTGRDFTLTRSQYIDFTGCDIPQNRYYTEKSSAVARKSRENGYDIEVIPEKLIFTKREKV